MMPGRPSSLFIKENPQYRHHRLTDRSLLAIAAAARAVHLLPAQLRAAVRGNVDVVINLV
jgi:hypothetical protein